MLNEIQIKEILADVIKKLKKSVNVSKEEPRIDGKFKPNPVYGVTVKLWHDIRVHSEGQIFPMSLFKSKFPNEDEDVFKYRKDNYQPVTESDWNRGIVNYDRVFNPQNYNIDWKEDEYFTKEYPKGPILSHYKSVVKGKKLEDPNAIIALDIKNNDALDNVERLPTDIIYHADKVIRDNKEYVLLMSEFKSVVSHGGHNRKIGFIFYLYDDMKIWKIRQIGKQIDYNFDIEVWFKHEFEYIPAQRLKGQIFEIEGQEYYKSYANSAVYPLNLKTVDSSTLQASKIRHAYLEKWEIDDECPNPDCIDGQVSAIEQEEEIKRTCTICEGTCRNLGSKGPLGKKSIIARTNEPLDAALIPPMGYIDKDPTILEFLQTQIDLNEAQAFAYLGVDISNTKVKGSDTALGKIIDREALENGMSLFSDEIWDTLRFNIKFCNDARRALGTLTGDEEPDVKGPNNYTIRTEKGLTEEYGIVEEKSLPDAYKSGIFKQLAKARFGTSELLQRTFKLKQLVDRLYLTNSKNLSIKKAQRTAQAWEIVLHDSFDTYVARELTKNDKFLDNIDKDWEVIKTQFETQAKADTETETTESLIEE